MSSRPSTTVPSRLPPRSFKSRSATPIPRSRSRSSSKPRLLVSSALLSTSTQLRPGVKAGCPTPAPRSTTMHPPPKATNSSSTLATTPPSRSKTSAGPSLPSAMLLAAAHSVQFRSPTASRRHSLPRPRRPLPLTPTPAPVRILPSTPSLWLRRLPRPTQTAPLPPPLLLPTRSEALHPLTLSPSSADRSSLLPTPLVFSARGLTVYHHDCTTTMNYELTTL